MMKGGSAATAGIFHRGSESKGDGRRCSGARTQKCEKRVPAFFSLSSSLSLPVCRFRAMRSFWSGILESTRAIDWSTVGVGGIPPRATACSTINPNGSNDMTATINSALSACPSGQAVLLAPGTFRVNGNIEVPANVTLRGAGAEFDDSSMLTARGME